MRPRIASELKFMTLFLTLLPIATVGDAKTSLFYQWKQIFVVNYGIQFVQYIVTAGVAFLIFYALWRKCFLGRKIQAAFPVASDIRREIFFSLQSLGVFAAVGVFSVMLDRLHWTKLYYRIDHYG